MTADTSSDRIYLGKLAWHERVRTAICETLRVGRALKWKKNPHSFRLQRQMGGAKAGLRIRLAS